MTLDDLISDVAKRMREQELNVSKAMLRKLLATTFAAITDAVRAGSDVRVPDFGVFRLKIRGPRAYFDVVKREKETSKEKFVPTFLPATHFKEAMPKSRFELMQYQHNKPEKKEKP